MLYFTGTFYLGTKLIWTLFLLVYSDLHSLDLDYLLIFSEVETWRWARPNTIPFEERRCTSYHSMEDEFHFVLECSRSNDLRTVYIPNYYKRRPNMFKLVKLVKSENKKIQINLSLYVFKAFKVREQFVFG